MTRGPIILLGVCAAFSAAAQALRDPTRPPMVDPNSGGEAAPAVQRLQSTLLSKGRRLAIIDGRTVALGDKVGDATLVALSESEAVLRRGDELERLRLLPGTDKKRSTAARSTAPASGEKGSVK